MSDRPFMKSRGKTRVINLLLLAGIFSALLPAIASAQLTSDDRPYDNKLLRLSEILGAVHYLRELCGARAPLRAL